MKNIRKTLAVLVAGLVLCVFLVSCLQTEDSRSAVTLREHRVTADTVRHVTFATATRMSDEGSLVVDGEVNRELLVERVKMTLADMLNVHLTAEEFDISLTSANRREIRSRIREMQRAFENRDNFLYLLTAIGSSEQTVFDLMYIEELEERLSQIVFVGMLNLGFDDIIADIEENFVFTTHIFISNRGRTPSEVTAEVDRLYALISAGVDMVDIATRYSDDAMSIGHIFTDGCDNTPLLFSRVAHRLAIGELEQVVTSHGVFLIRRNEITTDLAESRFSELFSDSNTRMFRDALRELAEELGEEVSFTDVFYEVLDEVLASFVEE
ncbi:MAG: hypothetical protein FWB93_06070 [Oscillospiraceae bacterium]|nr:hypothetical protein [Oscillospiraceae bacterium]